jgi:hypothetical protein
MNALRQERDEIPERVMRRGALGIAAVRLHLHFVAEYLAGHPKIARVHYLGFLEEGDPRKTVFDRQCSGPGSTFAFNIKGGREVGLRAARPSSGCEAVAVRENPVTNFLEFQAPVDFA